jgi:hypothetical protein
MKRGVRVFPFQYQTLQVFGTLSIHLTVSSLSHSTQFPGENGSKKEEPRSSRRLDCGDGQTSDVQTTLEEYLSHSAWKGMGITMGIAAVV